jgi:hypothetical protein
MTKENIERIPELVASGKMNWEQVTNELAVFIMRNKPMFALQKYDEDFMSEFIVQFLIKSSESFSSYETSKGNFLSYLFCIIRNIRTSLHKKAAIASRIEYHTVNESILNYENKVDAYENINYEEFEKPKIPYNYKPISIKAFQVACKTDSYRIKRVLNSSNTGFPEHIKEQLKDYTPKVVKNIIMVNTLKSAYYVTDLQIEKISNFLGINPNRLYETVQFMKTQMDSRIENKEKIEIRRNRAYFRHKITRDQIKWNDLNFIESDYENEKLIHKYNKTTKTWNTLNYQLEEGKIHIRPTTRLVAKFLGTSPRQVTYYQSLARKLGIDMTKV